MRSNGVSVASFAKFSGTELSDELLRGTDFRLARNSCRYEWVSAREGYYECQWAANGDEGQEYCNRSRKLLQGFKVAFAGSRHSALADDEARKLHDGNKQGSCVAKMHAGVKVGRGLGTALRSPPV